MYKSYLFLLAIVLLVSSCVEPSKENKVKEPEIEHQKIKLGGSTRIYTFIDSHGRVCTYVWNRSMGAVAIDCDFKD